MQRPFSFAVSAAVAAALCIVAAIWAQDGGNEDAAPYQVERADAGPPMTPVNRGIVAQIGFGGRCQTPAGTCAVPPQPINSVCFCGSVQGFILP